MDRTTIDQIRKNIYKLSEIAAEEKTDVASLLWYLARNVDQDEFVNLVSRWLHEIGNHMRHVIGKASSCREYIGEKNHS